MRQREETAPPKQSRVTRRLVSVPEVAEMLGGVSIRLVWRLLATGELHRVSCGRRTMVPIDSVEAFIAKGGSR